MMNNLKSPIKNSKLYWVGALVALLMFSCVPTQNIREANTKVPEQFKNRSNDTLNTATVKWKDFFKDPHLIALIDSALTNNQELNIMLQEVQVAKNEIMVRKGEYLPFVNIQAGAEVEKVGRYTSQGANDANTDIKEGEEFPEPLPNYQVAAVASWELDVWKKLRNSKKSCCVRVFSK